MKNIRFNMLLGICIFFLSVLLGACGGGGSPVMDEIDDGKQDGQGQKIVPPVADLMAEKTERANELQVSWTNPVGAISVEITYLLEGDKFENVTKKNIRIATEKVSTLLIVVSEPGSYIITAVAVDNYGRRSDELTVIATPLREEEVVRTHFLERADILMTSLMNLYFGKSARDCWNTKYPLATGPYWDGDAVVWGQGAGFSGFVALREVSSRVPVYQKKYADMTDRMYNSINRFITTDNNLKAYAVYPQNGNERYYDDNVWIGLDMAELYEQTKEKRFLEKAEMVWDYLMVGNTNSCGGGILWREKPVYSNKHTCSTAPAAVLGCKLYQITKEQKYLDKAKELYVWLIQYMQDPGDYLFYDNITPSLTIGKSKYSYNSGQRMQAACLLYNITGEQQYLTDAQQIVRSAHKKWFTLYDSKELREKIYCINGDHIWFYSVLFRGFLELYKIDGRREYVTAFEKSMLQAWKSECRNQNTNLLSNKYFVGKTNTSWEILHEGAFVEILARLAMLELEGK